MKRVAYATLILVLGMCASGQQGEQIYSQNCATCHGQEGGGGTGPALAGNQTLQDTQMVINQIKNGGGGMPAFGDQLSDEEIAAVASYIRTSWDNSFGEVSVEQVAQGGQQGQGQQGQQPPSKQTGGTGQAPPNSQTGGAGQPPSEQAGDAGQQGAGQGSLEITVEPGEAIVNVIGPGGFVSLVAVTGSQTLTQLEPGSYIVAATAQGRAVARANTEVQEGQSASVSLTLQPRSGQQKGQGGQVQQGQQQDQQAQEPAQVQQQGDQQAQQQAQNRQAQSQNNQQQAQAQQIFQQNCAQCHGDEGGGGTGPALAGNQALQDAQAVVDQIVNGGGGMPSFGGQLSDEQIAAVASYIRTHWGNSFGEVSPDQVSGQQD